MAETSWDPANALQITDSYSPSRSNALATRGVVTMPGADGR